MTSPLFSVLKRLSDWSSRGAAGGRWGRLAALVALAWGGLPAWCQGASGTWLNKNGGSWASGTNWQAGEIASGSYSTADFSTLDLTANATVTVDGARSIGTLKFGDSTPSHNWTLNTGSGGPLTIDSPTVIQVVNGTATVGAVLAGFMGVDKTGPGTLVLNAINTYTGDTSVQEGTLQLAAVSGTSGTLRGSLSIQPGAAVIATVGNALGYSGSNWVRTVTVNGGTFTTAAANGDQGWGVTYNLYGGTLTASRTGTRFAAGGGTRVNVYAATQPSVINGEFRLREGNTNERVIFDVADRLTVNGTITQSAAGRGIEKSGTGTMELLGSNSYTGATMVNAGSLKVSGSLGTSAASVASGATLTVNGTAGGTCSVASGGTLAGSGTITGATTVNGTLAPGDAGIGTLRLNSTLALSATATTQMEIRRIAGVVQSDRVQVSSTLTLGGTLTVTSSGDPLQVGDSFTLLAAGSRSGAFAMLNLPPLPGTLQWDTSLLAAQGILKVGKGTQTISFAPLPVKTMGDAPFELAATASSGLTVSYASSDPTVATIDGSLVTLTGSGTTVITASQGGDANYLSARNVTQTLTVNRAVREPQTISFGPLAEVTNTSPPFVLTASASSGLPVSYTSSNPAVATVAGGTLTIKGAGVTTITARQPGNTDFEPAADVPQTLTVTGTPQTISFAELPVQTFGNLPLNLAATASSGLTVSYASSDPGVASVAGNVLTLSAPGSAVITASQPGNATYDPAAPVARTLTVNPAAGALTVTPDPLAFSVRTGESASLPLQLANPSDGAVDWNLKFLDANGKSNDLEAVLAAIDASGSTLNGPLPDRYDFTEGETGTAIATGVPSGTNQIFNQGNKLGTNSGGPVAYSNGVVASSTALGTGGRYFTRKLPGLFLFAADLDGPTWFEVGGSLTYGSSRLTSEFSVTRGGKRWSAFVQKIVCTYTNTVNHLILVDQTGLSQTTSSYASDELQRIQGLRGKCRVYHLLYITAAKTAQPDAVFQDLANRLLEIVPGSLSGMLSAAPNAGSVAAAGSAAVTATVNAATVLPGSYQAQLAVSSPTATRLGTVPVSVEVSPPRLTLPQEPVRHVTVTGGPVGVVKVPLESGLAAEQPWSAQLTNATSWLSLAVASGTTPTPLELQFTPGTMTSGSYHSVVRITSGPATFELGVSMVVDSLAPVRMRADLLRPQLYVLHNGTLAGAVVVVSEAGAMTKVIATGKGPKDCAFSPDGRFLYTANYTDSTISEIDLTSLEVTRTRPVTLNKGSYAVDRFHLAAGRNGVIYHTDGANYPVVRAIDFDSGQWLSSYGTGATEGAGSMWYDNLDQRLYFHGQYHRDGGPTVVALATAGGTLSLAGRSAATGTSDTFQNSGLFASLNRDRLVAITRVHNLPALAVSGPELSTLARAVSAYGHLMASNYTVIDIATGTSVGSLQTTSGIGDFTRNQDTFVSYNSSTGKFVTWSVPAASRPPSVTFTPNPPANGVLPSDRPLLSWNGQPSVDGYRVYLGADRAAVENAVPGSAEDRGVTMATSYALNPLPAPGSVFYWRIDPIRGGAPGPGSVQAAAMAPFSVSPASYARRLPTGIQPQRVSFTVVDAAGQPVAWSLSESIAWFTPDSTSGAPGTPLRGWISVAGLAAGIQRGTLTVAAGGMSLPVPLEITVYAPNISLLRADPARPLVYGLHTGSTTIAESQLFAIRASTGAIEMAVDAGTNATDFTIDAAADRLYATNSGKPLLQVVDLTDFTLLAPLAVSADTRGVAADGRGRLVLNCRPANSARVDLVDATSGTVLGTVPLSNYESNYVGDVDPAGTRYYAGWNSSPYGLFAIDITTNQPGTPVKLSTGSSARPLFNRAGTRVVQGYSAFDASFGQIAYFGDYARATDSGGRVTVGSSKLFWTESGAAIGALPVTADLAAVSGDDTYAVLWNATNKTLTSMRLDTLVTLPGPSPQPGEQLPHDSPVAFAWPGSPTATSYQVFLGTAEAEVTAAVAGSAWHLATVTTPEWTMAAPPAAGFRYFWRIDTVRGGVTTKGGVWWFDVPLPAAADPVPGPTTMSGSYTFHLGEGGLAVAIDSAATSYLYRLDPSDGHPLPWQQIPLNWSNYYVSPKPAIGQRWTVVGDRHYSTADNSSGGLMLLQPWRDQWQFSQIVVPPTSPAKAYFGSAVACDGGVFLVGMPGNGNSAKLGRVAAYREWPDFALMQEFQASDGGVEDGFGKAIAMQGGRVLVGADGDDITRQGRGYIFEFNPATRLWTQQASLVPVTSGNNRNFGSVVALDGDTAVLGATNSIVDVSQVHVYNRAAGGAWSKSASLSEPNGYSYARNNYGGSLAVAGDMLFVGASATSVRGQTAGMVHVFRRSGSNWRIAAPLLPPPDTQGFGSALAIRDGVLYVSSTTKIFTYRLAPVSNKTPRFTDAPPTQFVAGVAVDREIVATDPDGTAGLAIQAEALPTGLSLQDLGDGRAKLSGTPSGAVGATHFLRWRVTDPAGARAWQTAQVTLVDPDDVPELVTEPVSQEAGVGVDVVLRASATGVGPFTWQWRKDGKDLPSANDSSLWLYEVTPAQAGTYTVVVRNAAGEVESDPAEITVRAANPHAGDWPTLGNSPAHTGRHPAALESYAFVPAWSTVAQSGRSLQRATIADGRAIVVPQSSFATGLAVKAISLASGEIQWSYPLPAVFSANPPSVYNGRVYFQLGKGTSDPPDPQLHCLNAATGTKIWASNFDAQWENYEAPAVTDMGIFINGGYYGGMYRFDLDGTQRFFRSMAQISGWTPTVYRDRLFTCVGGTFIEHFPGDGGTMWSLANVSGNNLVAAHEDAAVTVDSAKLSCIDLTNRAIRWQVSGSFRGRASIGAGYVHAIQGTAVRSYALADGSPGTVYQADANPTDQPIILNDRLIVASDTKTWIFRLADGQLLQTLAAGGRLSYSNGYLLASGNDGTLRAFVVAPLPRLVVEHEGQALDDGSSVVDCGVPLIGQPSLREFTLRNTGLAELNGIEAAVDGAAAADFVVTSAPADTLAPGQSTSFTLTFTPSAGGTRAAVLQIASNDAERAPFDVALTGKGNRAPVFPGHTFTVMSGAPASIAAAKVAARGTDPDGDPLTLSGAFGPSAHGGSVTMGGMLVYTPPAGFTGSDSFEVEVSDPHGATGRGTVTVTVTAPPAGVAALGQNMTEFSMQAGKITLAFRGIPGRAYLVQRSTDLTSWTTLATVTAGPDGRIPFTDPAPPLRQAFYRTARP